MGGLKEKILAAHRSGLREAIIPKANLHDLADLPPSVRRELRFHLVETVDEAIGLALLQGDQGAPAQFLSAVDGASAYEIGK